MEQAYTHASDWLNGWVVDLLAVYQKKVFVDGNNVFSERHSLDSDERKIEIKVHGY